MKQMSFNFHVEHAAHLPMADVWIVDGKLLSGDIHAATTVAKTDSGPVAIKVKNVAMIDPPTDSSRMTLVIDKPPCSIENLEGTTLVSVEAPAGQSWISQEGQRHWRVV